MVCFQLCGISFVKILSLSQFDYAPMHKARSIKTRFSLSLVWNNVTFLHRALTSTFRTPAASQASSPAGP